MSNLLAHSNKTSRSNLSLRLCLHCVHPAAGDPDNATILRNGLPFSEAGFTATPRTRIMIRLKNRVVPHSEQGRRMGVSTNLRAAPRGTGAGPFKHGDRVKLTETAAKGMMAR